MHTKTSEWPFTGKTLDLATFQQECATRDLPSTGTGITAKEKSQLAGVNIIDWAEKKKPVHTLPSSSYPTVSPVLSVHIRSQTNLC